MNVSSRAAIVLIRIAHGFINTFVLTVILLLLAFGLYTMWDSGQIHTVASSARYERFKPTAENDGVSFEYLQTVNPDVFAWLTVYGTNIDYPMVQGRDNMKYVNTSAEGKHSLPGAIFLDYRNCPSFTDFNSIVYGHHMENRAMFGEIAMFSDKDYFDAREYGTLFFDGAEHGLEFFAFVYADANDTRIFRVNVTTDEAKQAYLDLLTETAVHTREDISVTVDDRIILLSTCSPNSTTGRDILIGKITGDVRPDPFETEPERETVIISVIDELPDFWEQAGAGLKNALAALTSLVILIAVLLIRKARRERRKPDKDKLSGRRGE